MPSAELYYHLWPARLYHIFSHYIKNGTIFGEILFNIKCVFWFSLQILLETFLILTINKRDITPNVQKYLCKVPDILSKILMKLELSQIIFEKILRYQIS
jgi:hypothetical protein